MGGSPGFADGFAPNFLWKETSISERTEEFITTFRPGQNNYGALPPRDFYKDDV